MTRRGAGTKPITKRKVAASSAERPKVAKAQVRVGGAPRTK